MNSLIICPTINDDIVKTTLRNIEDTRKLEIMKDERVIYWYRDSVMEKWRTAIIYKNYDDFNKNLWMYNGEVDTEVRKPLGNGIEYNEEKDDVEDVYYWIKRKDYNNYSYCDKSIKKFVGELKDRLMNGYGSLYEHNNEYIGYFKNGKRHGYGKQICHLNGWSYEGEWSHGEITGYGTFYCEFYKHIGQYISGEANGHGTQVWHSDGARYEGKFINDMMNGEGAYFCKNYTYVGEFVDDLCEGLGKITWKNGNSYEGKFIDDAIDLYYDGVFTFADGSKYIGIMNKIWDVIVSADEHKI